ncbi:MAG: GNAT family N-acetyltransferase [Actinomycetes bacterium]
MIEEEAWVAEEGERVVGLLVLRSRRGHVLPENVAVAPKARKRGIGEPDRLPCAATGGRTGTRRLATSVSSSPSPSPAPEGSPLADRLAGIV